ncbi:MAG: YSIRK-type signal peptide-containing protein, partial [Flavobacteriaceae bacterium]|nr:YSIRK-type signal peptide-containing protein [Flavobacteriaceae bacterium]
MSNFQNHKYSIRKFSTYR